MQTLPEFITKFNSESSCISALADLKWPNGFLCRKCKNEKAFQLKSRPKIFECPCCGNQESVMASTIFHKTKTPLVSWFIAAYMLLNDKRGVSAMHISQSLKIRYATAWLMLHKLRHALTERDEFKLESFVEVDETFYGHRKTKGAPGRSKVEDKSMIVVAVEKKSIFKRPNGKKGGLKNTGWIAGAARISVIQEATKEQLHKFIRANVQPKTRYLTDGWKSYRGLDGYKHVPIVQGKGENSAINQPIIHTIFSNVKAWLNGTHHGVSAKHLPRYLREWCYRFNRRNNADFSTAYVLKRVISRSTITYAELVGGAKVNGATA